MSATEEQIQQWSFFCREVAKANEILYLVEDLWKNIEISNGAYNQVFSLLIDALTTKILLHIGHLFDNQDDSLRLSRIIRDKESQSELEKLKKEAEPFIATRHREHAHLSKYAKEINYGSNFRLMQELNVKKIREILKAVSRLLAQWGILHNNGIVIADRWGNIGPSRELLFHTINVYDLISSEMDDEELAGFMRKYRESKNV